MGIEGDYINGNHSCCFAVSAERKAKAKAVLLITIAAASHCGASAPGLTIYYLGSNSLP